MSSHNTQFTYRHFQRNLMKKTDSVNTKILYCREKVVVEIEKTKKQNNILCGLLHNCCATIFSYWKPSFSYKNTRQEKVHDISTSSINKPVFNKILTTKIWLWDSKLTNK